MAGKTAVLKVTIVGDASGASKAFGAVDDGVGKTQAAFKKMMPAALAASAAIVTGGTIAVKAASDQQQAFGALDSILGKNADATKAWADDQAKIGLSATDAANSVALLAAQLKNQGNTTQEAAAKSQELVALGADLAATFGGSTADAVAALSSALKGEMDPIEKYGISLNDAALKTQAMEMGIYSGKGALDAQAKSLATQALLWEQSADAQGQAAREADSVAGSMATLKANTANATAALGEALLPIIAAVTEKLAGFAAWARQNTGTVQAIAAVIGVLAGAVLLVNGALAAWSAVVAVWSAVTAVATAVGTAFSAMMLILTAPITWVILAIVALIAIVVLLWKNWDTVTAALGKAWDWLKAKALAIFGALKTFLSGIWNTISATVTSVWNTIKTSLAAAWNTIKTKAIEAFTALKTKMADIWTGIKDGITKKVHELIRAAKDLPGDIVRAIGNLDRLLYQKGRDLIQGLINGIESLLGSIGRTISGAIPDWVPGIGRSGPTAALIPMPTVRGTSTASAAPTPHVSVYVSIDELGRARVTKRALEANDRRQGRRPGQELAVAW